MSLESLIQSIKNYNPEADFDLLKYAYKFGEECHQGQKRKSGAPYFSHCIGTAKILIDLKLDLYTICAAILHDTIEDNEEITRDKLAWRFGETVADLVEGVPKISQYHFRGGVRQRQAESYLKLLLATAQDVRVILIKLADRLHNMETLSFQPESRQREIAKETFEVYAPMAQRLGIARLKSRLEDLSFKHTNPEEYKLIANLLNQKLVKREDYANQMAEEIRSTLRKSEVAAEVYGRPKSIYSIHQKMKEKGAAFEEIFDLMGLRILVNNNADCYRCIGVIHDGWHHVPVRFKDFIGLPKANGYRSLHTTIMDEGRRIEIQVRTHTMHEVAEDGIAAHWSYKEGVPSTNESETIFKWLRGVLEDIRELRNPNQFIRSMKHELLADQVYVFTPRGDVIELPAGATSIDFAYKIHTQVGDTCKGTEVNGMIMSLRYRLRNGDRVKIITDVNAHPVREWLRWVRTAKAQNRIRQWFREQDRVQAIELGKRFLEIEMKRPRTDINMWLKSERAAEILQILNLKSSEDLLQHIGTGQQLPADIMKLVSIDNPPKDIESTDGVIFHSTPTIDLNTLEPGSIRIMKCCNPIPGDEVVAYLTKGKGISIHRYHCRRIPNEEVDRLIQVNWEPIDGLSYPTAITLEVHDRSGILGKVTTVIAERKINIRAGNFGPASLNGNINANLASEGVGYNKMMLEVTGLKQLEQAMGAIRQLKEVIRVSRS
ncbi:TPA: (p)ppGpp synthetase [Candidatus Poribacteria bacterium]|nr:(p)ppGpp synthetase [Candidatus Poribacteria bacterium]